MVAMYRATVKNGLGGLLTLLHIGYKCLSLLGRMEFAPEGINLSSSPSMSSMVRPLPPGCSGRWRGLSIQRTTHKTQGIEEHTRALAIALWGNLKKARFLS
jgi:hypothetical protein